VALHIASDGIGPVLIRRAQGEDACDLFCVLTEQRVIAAGRKCLPQGALGGIKRGVVEAVIR